MIEIQYRDAIREAISEEMIKDETVIFLGEDIATSKGTFMVSNGLIDKFGDKRIIGTPISEGTMVGAAVGASITGLRPIVEIMFLDFITLAMDQIVNQAAKIRFMSGNILEVPIVVRSPGGIIKTMGAHHTQNLEAWFYNVPGLKLVIPSTPYDAKGLLKTSIRDNGPVIFIEHKLLYASTGLIPEDEYTIPLGKADIKKEGSDVTIFAYSKMVLTALEAAKELEEENISCEVIDPRTLVPLDEEAILESVKKTGRMVIASEACERGGIGSHICSLVVKNAFDYLDAPIEIVAGLNTPIPYNKLSEFCYPHKQDIINAVKRLV